MLFAFAFTTGMITGAAALVALLEGRYRAQSIQYQYKQPVVKPKTVKALRLAGDIK